VVALLALLKTILPGIEKIVGVQAVNLSQHKGHITQSKKI
jgi:hypothetical protein